MSADGRFRVPQLGRDESRGKCPNGAARFICLILARSGEFLQTGDHLISTDPNGALVGTESILPSVSSSGRFCRVSGRHSQPFFESGFPGLPRAAATAVIDRFFIRDTCLGATNCTPKTTRISLQPGDGTASISKPAGPALSSSAGHVAIAGANAATLSPARLPWMIASSLAMRSQQH